MKKLSKKEMLKKIAELEEQAKQAEEKARINADINRYLFELQNVWSDKNVLVFVDGIDVPSFLDNVDFSLFEKMVRDLSPIRLYFVTDENERMCVYSCSIKKIFGTTCGLNTWNIYLNKKKGNK